MWSKFVANTSWGSKKGVRRRRRLLGERLLSQKRKGGLE
ncbi:hypothetical protein LINGRAHAP2_LOCUS13148 [Linum grandiflorum]